MQTKKILIIPLLSVLGATSFASYIVQYPEQPIVFKDLGTWVANEPVVTTWLNVGNPHDCENASPLENTQQLGVTYVKTFSDCKQLQERTITTSEKNTVSGVIRNSVSKKESQTLTNATYTANAVGTTDFGQWLPTAPVYTDWRNLESPRDCTSAAPLENTQTAGSTYPKVFSGCKQSQEREVTTSEKNSITGTIRNVKTTKENQVLTDVTYTITATGTKVVKECFHSDSAASYRWYDIATSDNYTTTYGMGLDWNGSKKINTANISKTYPKAATFVSEGYVYTRGVFKVKSSYYDQNRSYYYYYEVCREPVTP